MNSQAFLVLPLRNLESAHSMLWLNSPDINNFFFIYLPSRLIPLFLIQPFYEWYFFCLHIPKFDSYRNLYHSVLSIVYTLFFINICTGMGHWLGSFSATPIGEMRPALFLRHTNIALCPSQSVLPFGNLL